MRVINFILMCFVLCLASPACSGDNIFDVSYLYPDSVKGVWIQYIEKQSATPGQYYKDSCFYRIGMDSLRDAYTGTERWRYFMTFYKVYPTGGFEKGYVFNHNDPEDFDFNQNMALLQYTLVLQKVNGTVETTVKFTMPAQDSLTIQVGGDRPIGVRRQWR